MVLVVALVFLSPVTVAVVSISRTEAIIHHDFLSLEQRRLLHRRQGATTHGGVSHHRCLRRRRQPWPASRKTNGSSTPSGLFTDPLESTTHAVGYRRSSTGGYSNRGPCTTTTADELRGQQRVVAAPQLRSARCRCCRGGLGHDQTLGHRRCWAAGRRRP